MEGLQHMTRPQRPPRRLDLAELQEPSVLADLIAESDGGIGQPTPSEFVSAPVITHWSVAPGPYLFGLDDAAEIVALEVWSVAASHAWAMTSRGCVRLAVPSRLPLVTKGGAR
jgi:hypothetical protein